MGENFITHLARVQIINDSDEMRRKLLSAEYHSISGIFLRLTKQKKNGNSNRKS